MLGTDKISPELLMALGGGIMQGQNLGQGLGTGFQNAAVVMGQQKEQAAVKAVENKTREWLKQQFPGENFDTMTPETMKTYVNQAVEKRFAKPKFMTVDGKIVKLDETTGANEVVGDYSEPKTTAEYQDFQLQQKDPAYRAAKEEERNAKDAPSPKDNFESEQTLWKNWRSDADVKEYQGVRNGFEKIRASAIDPTGPKDLGIIFGYMKMLDPASVVREGEQASVANSGGVPQQVMNWYNKALTGEQLPPQVRADILKAAESLYQESAKNYESVNEQVRNMAERYNVDPQFITPAEKYEPLKIGQKIETTVGGKKATIERVSE